MRENGKGYGSNDSSKTGSKLFYIALARLILIFFAMVGLPLIWQLHGTMSGILFLAGCVVVYFLLYNYSDSLETAYQLNQVKAVDFTGIISSYIQLESFDRTRTFSRTELSHLMPDGGFGHATYKVSGRNMIRGSWEGHNLRSAYVDYEDDSSLSDYPRSVLFEGQYTEIEGQTGFPGKMLLIRPRKQLAAHKDILAQTGLTNRRVEADSLPGWEVYSDRPGDAREILSSNREFINRIKLASGMRFMLIEEKRVCFCGDYAFNTVDFNRGYDGANEDCEHAMCLLTDEGLAAVKPLWQD